MMMWTKNAVNPSQPDAAGGGGRQSRVPSPHSVDGEPATMTPDGAPPAGTRVVHVHEGTCEQIAYKLFLHILEMDEVYDAAPNAKGDLVAHRQYICNTYAQCIKAVWGEKYS